MLDKDGLRTLEAVIGIEELAEIVKAYFFLLPGQLTGLEDAIVAKNMNAIMRSAHTIKGSSGI